MARKNVTKRCVIAIGVSTLLAACAVDQAGSLVDGLFGGQSGPVEADSATPATAARTEPPPAGSAAGPVQIKQMRKLAPVASVMLEKNCPLIVQPYQLSDNVASVGFVAAQQELRKIDPGIAKWFGAPTSVSSRTDSLDAAKLAAKQLNWLPMSAERMFGERQHALEPNVLGRGSKRGRQIYPIADRMLAEILASVQAPHEYQFQIFVLKNDTRNAVALPGGYLHVDEELFSDSANHPKAYFAIAHEVAHVLQRHETIELQSRVVDSFDAKDDLLATISRVRSNPQVILQRVKVRKDLFTRHHMDQELQADSCAARMLSRTLPEAAFVQSLSAFVEDLQPDDAAGKTTPRPRSSSERAAGTVYEIVSTPIARHPSARERLQNLRSIQREISRGTSASR